MQIGFPQSPSISRVNKESKCSYSEALHVFTHEGLVLDHEFPPQTSFNGADFTKLFFNNLGLSPLRKQPQLPQHVVFIEDIETPFVILTSRTYRRPATKKFLHVLCTSAFQKAERWRSPGGTRQNLGIFFNN